MPYQYDGKRPSSPYQSRRMNGMNSTTGSLKKAKVWRSLSGTGYAHVTHPHIEDSKAMWLKSLRQGTGTRSQVRVVHGTKATQDSVNLALASSSEYLKQELGIPSKPNHQTPRSSLPGTPRYKPQEDMYDEIIELKKTIQSQKLENDQLKAKVRYSEEENAKKKKCIDQLIEQAASLNSTTGKNKEHQLIVTTLRNQNLKSSTQLEQSEKDLKDARAKTKDLKSRAKAAKNSYLQEVMKLQQAVEAQNQEIRKLNGYASDDDEETMRAKGATDVKTLRAAVVKLTAAQSQLQEDNKCLRRDLEHALEAKTVDDQGREKQTEAYNEKLDKLKTKMIKFKDEINSLSNENSRKTLEIEHLNDDVAKVNEENRVLRQQLENMKLRQQDTSPANKRRTSRPVTSVKNQHHQKVEDFTQNRAARKIQKSWRHHHAEVEEGKYDQGVSLIQSTMRGHLARDALLNQRSTPRDHHSTNRNSPSALRQIRERDYSDDLYDDDDDDLSDADDVRLLQSAMRGHLARTDLITATAGGNPRARKSPRGR